MAAKSLEDMTVPELLEHTRKLEKDNSLLNTLSSDPDTRRELLRLAKKKMPNTPIPEIDNTLEAERMLAVADKKIEALETRVRDGEIRARIEAEESRLKKEHGFDDNDMQEVRKLMVDEKAPIPHFDAAAKVYNASRRQAEPSSSQLRDNSYEMPDHAMWGKGVGNKAALNKVFVNEAYRAVNELRNPKAA